MKEILLTHGMATTVDDAMYETLNRFRWYAKQRGRTWYVYRKRKTDGKQHSIYMHREILGLEPGDGLEADHRNGNGLDNRLRKLRIVTHQENNFNRHRCRGYMRRRKSYYGAIRVHDREIWLGTFTSARDAHHAYLEAKKTYHRIPDRRTRR